MFRKWSIPIVLVTVAAVGGWASANGKLFTTKSDSNSALNQPALPVGATPFASTGCCSSGDKVAAIAKINAHNETVAVKAKQDGKKPNIVIIWGDDIGQSNVSAYSRGMMGYQTPNIDRVAKEGMLFTDYYAEQAVPQAGLRSSPVSTVCARG